MVQGVRHSTVKVEKADDTLKKLTEESKDFKEWFGWFDLEGVTSVGKDMVYVGMENKPRLVGYNTATKKITSVLNLPGKTTFNNVQAL